jgi:hypothetical protein
MKLGEREGSLIWPGSTAIVLARKGLFNYRAFQESNFSHKYSKSELESLLHPEWFPGKWHFKVE